MGLALSMNLYIATQLQRQIVGDIANQRKILNTHLPLGQNSSNFKAHVFGSTQQCLRELGFVQERNATKDPLVGRTRKWHWPDTGDTGAAR